MIPTDEEIEEQRKFPKSGVVTRAALIEKIDALKANLAAAKSETLAEAYKIARGGENRFEKHGAPPLSLRNGLGSKPPTSNRNSNLCDRER